MNIATFEEFSMGSNPSEGSEISIDPTIIENLIELVGSEEEVESAAKEAFEELKKAFDENDVELKEGDAPESLAMSALVLKLVEKGKLGPQEADTFIEENLGEPENVEDESESDEMNESDESERFMPSRPQLISKESKTETFDEMVFSFPEEELEFIIRVYDDGYSTFHFGDGIQIDTSYSNDEYLDEYKKYHDSILSELGMEDNYLPWRGRNEE